MEEPQLWQRLYLEMTQVPDNKGPWGGGAARALSSATDVMVSAQRMTTHRAEGGSSARAGTDRAAGPMAQ